MSTGQNTTWSKSEKQVARRAYDLAYHRECAAIAARVREMLQGDSTPERLWQLHDLLTEERREVDEKYDYRYSVLIFVFARLLREEWLHVADLDGLSEDKVQ